MAYWNPSASRYSYTSGRAKAASPRSSRRRAWPRYRATTGVEHRAPPVGAVDVARSQRAPFQVAILIEHEEWMIAGAGEVPVVRGAFLRAVRWAHAAVDVQDQRCSCTPHLRAVDPAPGEIGQRRQVRRRGHRAGLEAAHLARRRALVRHRTPTDHPAHRGIPSEPVGIVHVLVAGKAPEHRLA